jgi:hypothetical protein
MPTRAGNKDQELIDLLSECYDLSPYEDHKPAFLSGWALAIKAMSAQELTGFIHTYTEKVNNLRATHFENIVGLTTRERVDLLTRKGKI